MNEPSDLTITELIPRGTVDNYGNQQYTARFAEYPNQVYAAFKSPPPIGTKKWGTIKADGGNGPAFKSAKKLDFQGGAPQSGGFTPQSNYQPRQAAPKKSDSERSNDIRWGLCLKEANLYVSKYRPDLDAHKWSQEVVEYASALFLISNEPQPAIQEAPIQDQLPDELLDGSEPIEIKDFPF